MTSTTEIARELELELQQLEKEIAQRERRRSDLLEQLLELRADAHDDEPGSVAEERRVAEPSIGMVYPRRQQDALDMLAGLIAASEGQDPAAGDTPAMTEREHQPPTSPPAEPAPAAAAAPAAPVARVAVPERVVDRYYRGPGQPS